MSDYKIINATEDIQRYIDIYNRRFIFAPYTLPLTKDLFENHVLKTYNENSQMILIGHNPKGEGIIHTGWFCPDNSEDKIGMIYILAGDNNNITESLLREAEEWFKSKKISRVQTCLWRPSPYKFILHGAETYTWAGEISAINAYRRLNYDILLESVIMIADIDTEPVVTIPDIAGLSFEVEDLTENELVRTGKVKAFINGDEAGSCTYFYLKAISNHFNKPIGQIAIGIKNNFYGKGLGQALLLSAHNELYKLGARKVMLHTAQHLFRAIKLYEKTGYKEQNIRAFCFEKELTF